MPALYADLEATLREHALQIRLQSFFQMGSWIGGDRDGNPNVTAETLEHASERQAAVIFAHYLEEVHRLGAELSVSNLLAGSSNELKALADTSSDSSLRRIDEPYRRALIGIYARLAASAQVRLGEWVVPVRIAGSNAAGTRAAVHRFGRV